MERTKEELQQIYDDLLVFKEKLNWLNSLGENWPTPFDGKTWQEEKEEFYDKGINTIVSLLQTEAIKSCEVISICQMEANWLISKKDESLFDGLGFYYYDFSDYRFDNSKWTLENVIEELGKSIDSEVGGEKIRTMNRVLNEITHNNCIPRACSPFREDTYQYAISDLLTSQGRPSQGNGRI